MSMDDFVGSLSPEQKKKLLQALGASETEEIEAEAGEELVSEDFKVTRNDQTTNTRRTKVTARENKWVDTGEFRDVETPDVARTPRRRGAPKKQDIECHVCGKTYKIDPRYTYGEYYRCNKCTGR